MDIWAAGDFGGFTIIFNSLYKYWNEDSNYLYTLFRQETEFFDKNKVELLERYYQGSGISRDKTMYV